MLKLQSILVPVDMSVSARNAFHVARDLAERFHAAVHVLHVTPTSGQLASFVRWLTERSGATEELSEEHETEVRRELEHQFGGYDPLKCVQRRGPSVAQSILEYVDECSIDLVVMGTHGHRSIDHPALGGTTGDVVRKSTQPVLSIRSRDDEERQFEGFSRIVVALDFGEESRSVLRAAKQLASTYGASLSLLFVAEEHNVPVFTDTGLMSVTTLRVDEEIAARAGEALRQIDEETGASDIEREHVVRHGSPARAIVSHAREAGADLIVIGRRGHSPHEGYVLGTVTEHVVRRSTCPVLTFGSTPE